MQPELDFQQETKDRFLKLIESSKKEGFSLIRWNPRILSCHLKKGNEHIMSTQVRNNWVVSEWTTSEPISITERGSYFDTERMKRKWTLTKQLTFTL